MLFVVHKFHFVYQKFGNLFCFTFELSRNNYGCSDTLPHDVIHFFPSKTKIGFVLSKLKKQWFGFGKKSTHTSLNHFSNSLHSELLKKLELQNCTILNDTYFCPLINRQMLFAFVSQVSFPPGLTASLLPLPFPLSFSQTSLSQPL